MRCLTYAECADWCSRRGFPTRHIEGYIAGPEPVIESPAFHVVDFSLPSDSGQKVAFSRFLYSLVEPAPELLFWVGEWSVWPSSGHIPLFTRFREAVGESRALIDAPGHLITPEQANDALSILVIALQFVWDCHVLTWSGRDALFVSHDEFGRFASRDESVTAAVRRKLEQAWGATVDSEPG